MFTLVGGLGSPYSLKMRAYLRYRRVPHRWVLRTLFNAVEHGGATMVPVLVWPDGATRLDSTRLILRLEDELAAAAPAAADRGVLPADPGVAFVARLIEDFADEFLTKAMYAGRWHRAEDQDFGRSFVGLGLSFPAPSATSDPIADSMRERQVSRNGLVMGVPANAPLLDALYAELLDLLEAHLAAGEAFLLGGARPTLADFGVFGQLTQLALVDGTPLRTARARSVRTVIWTLRMDDLSGLEDLGEHTADLAALPPIAHALLRIIGRIYLPFLLANAAAHARVRARSSARSNTGAGAGKDERAGKDEAAGADEGDAGHFASAGGYQFVQPVGYQVKCLAWLREALAAVPPADRPALDRLLAANGCLDALLLPTAAAARL